MVLVTRGWRLTTVNHVFWVRTATRMARDRPPGAVMSFSAAWRVTRGDGGGAGWGWTAIKIQPSVKPAMIVHNVESTSLSNVTGLPRSPKGLRMGGSGRSQRKTCQSDSLHLIAERSRSLTNNLKVHLPLSWISTLLRWNYSDISSFYHSTTSACVPPLLLPKYSLVPDVLTSC